MSGIGSRLLLSSWRGARRLLLLLLQLFSLLLELFLQLPLGFLEHLRIGRRAVIGLLEFAGERQRQRQRCAVGIDRLNNEVLALLHVVDKLGRGFVVGHAAVLEADHIRALQRRIVVHDDAGAVHQLHAERQRHAQDLFRLAFWLDDDGRDDRLARLDTAVLAGEADLLGIGVLALEAELGPGGVDQLDLLIGRLGRALLRWSALRRSALGGCLLGGCLSGRRRRLWGSLRSGLRSSLRRGGARSWRGSLGLGGKRDGQRRRR